MTVEQFESAGKIMRRLNDVKEEIKTVEEAMAVPKYWFVSVLFKPIIKVHCVISDKEIKIFDHDGIVLNTILVKHLENLRKEEAELKAMLGRI